MTTEPYRPSNGTEGDIFMSQFCSKCAREDFNDPDEAEGGVSCNILTNALCCSISDKEYPKEWVRDTESHITDIGGKGARCTAFVERGKDISYRCDKTTDMFGQ